MRPIATHVFDEGESAPEWMLYVNPMSPKASGGVTFNTRCLVIETDREIIVIGEDGDKSALILNGDYLSVGAASKPVRIPCKFEVLGGNRP